MYIDNGGRNQPDLTPLKKILTKFDRLKESTSQTTYLPTKKLITNNRKDILYRIDMLNLSNHDYFLNP